MEDTLARISRQRLTEVEANTRRQGCRGAIHRARLPTYCALGDVHKLLLRAMATGPFAPIVLTVVRKTLQPRKGAVEADTCVNKPHPKGRARGLVSAKALCRQPRSFAILTATRGRAVVPTRLVGAQHAVPAFARPDGLCGVARRTPRTENGAKNHPRDTLKRTHARRKRFGTKGPDL